MSDEAYDVALGVLRGFTMGEEVGSQALAVIESQNQALQERIEELEKLLHRWKEIAHERLGTTQLLSPTQETDPE